MPSKVRRASRKVKASGIGKLLRWVSPQYGVAAGWGKAAAALLVLSGPAYAENVTIAALGDSLTQGYGLPVEDGFVPQLQAWLRDAGADVTLINAGVSGDTTAGGLSRVAWTLTPEVSGMIVALGGNDLLRGIDPANSRANLTGIMEAAQTAGVQVVVVGMQAPGNYGPDYKEQFDQIYPDLAAKYGARLIPGFFEGLGDDLGQARGLFQADGIHPNRDGVARIVATMGPQLLPLLRDLGACSAGCDP